MGTEDVVGAVVLDDGRVMHGSSGGEAAFFNLALDIVCVIGCLCG